MQVHKRNWHHPNQTQTQENLKTKTQQDSNLPDKVHKKPKTTKNLNITNLTIKPSKTPIRKPTPKIPTGNPTK